MRKAGFEGDAYKVDWRALVRNGRKRKNAVGSKVPGSLGISQASRRASTLRRSATWQRFTVSQRVTSRWVDFLIISLTFLSFRRHRQFVEIRGDEFSVSKIFLHAGYDKPKYANDIAVIEMDKECDDEGICIGYGDSSVASEIAIVKQVEIPSMHAKIRKTSESECRSHYNQFAGLGDGQFCAKVQSNDSDLSQILSVVAIDTDKNRRHTLGGFTSTAIRSDAASNSADKTFIFTDTRFHASWIKAAIGDNVKPRSQPKFDDTQLTATSCQVSGADGFCVDLNQCSLFREAPKPLSRSRVEFLKRIKCLKSSSEESNNVNEDGICCPLKYVELGYVEPEKQDGPLKRGLEALDLQKCGKVPTTTRIVGGNNAGLKEFPWIGLIKYKIGRFNKFTCGASLISSKHVLTCAHCVTNLPAGYSIEAVRLGEYDLSTDPDCRQVDQDLRECNPSYQDVPIAELIPHADYNTPRYANDIALVRLARAPDMKEGECDTYRVISRRSFHALVSQASSPSVCPLPPTFERSSQTDILWLALESPRLVRSQMCSRRLRCRKCRKKVVNRSTIRSS